MGLPGLQPARFLVADSLIRLRSNFQSLLNARIVTSWLVYKFGFAAALRTLSACIVISAVVASSSGVELLRSSNSSNHGPSSISISFSPHAYFPLHGESLIPQHGTLSIHIALLVVTFCGGAEGFGIRKTTMCSGRPAWSP